MIILALLIKQLSKRQNESGEAGEGSISTDFCHFGFHHELKWTVDCKL